MERDEYDWVDSDWRTASTIRRHKGMQASALMIAPMKSYLFCTGVECAVCTVPADWSIGQFQLEHTAQLVAHKWREVETVNN